MQAGQRGGHRQIVLAEGVGMDDAALHGIENAVHDLAAGDDRADRHISARERLGDADDVGLDIRPVLEAEPFAGAAQAALHFIDDQQRAVFAAEPLGLGEIAVVTTSQLLPCTGSTMKRRPVCGCQGRSRRADR
jgi:hypothetical protein